MKPLKTSLGLKVSLGASLILCFFFTIIFSIIEVTGANLALHLRWLLLVATTIIGTIVAVSLLVYFLVERPLRSMRHIMQQTEKRHFLLRIPIKTTDVLGDLAHSFNRMLERITTLDAFKVETERELIMAQEELKYKKALEEKTKMIEEVNEILGTKIQEQSLLYEIARMLTSTIEKEQLFEVIGEALTNKIGIRDFALLLYNEESQILEVQTVKGFQEAERIKQVTFSVGEGITGRVMTERKTVYVPDTSQEPCYMHYKGLRAEDGSFVCIPLIFREKLVGTLNVTRPKANAFTDEEIELLEAAGSQMAMAIVNAKLYDTMKEVAIIDELTQIYNRRYFQQMLPQEIIRAKRFRKPVSLLIVDIDHFKKYNDTHGHIAGDIVLREFAQLVPHYLREVDFWARYGGEEFAIILPNTSKASSKKVAEKVLEAISKHKFPKGETLPGRHLTASAGVASYPTDAKDMDKLILCADAALYEAKRNGRNRFEMFTKTTQMAPAKKTTAQKFTEKVGEVIKLVQVKK
jgi:diguanylate cyclase (GGDEF)-like protein